MSKKQQNIKKLLDWTINNISNTFAKHRYADLIAKNVKFYIQSFLSRLDVCIKALIDLPIEKINVSTESPLFLIIRNNDLLCEVGACIEHNDDQKLYEVLKISVINYQHDLLNAIQKDNR